MVGYPGVTGVPMVVYPEWYGRERYTKGGMVGRGIPGYILPYVHLVYHHPCISPYVHPGYTLHT